MCEIWKDIKNYEGLYQVSSLSRIRSIGRFTRGTNSSCKFQKGKVLNPSVASNGYLLVTLSKGGKTKSFFIHRLVAEAFIPNPNNFPCVNHKDENPLNNQIDNLEWCSYKYNLNYGTSKKRLSKKHSKPVMQFTPDGVFIAEYNSAKEAEIKGGFCQVSIRNCCHNKSKFHKGFVWKFKEKENAAYSGITLKINYFF